MTGSVCVAEGNVLLLYCCTAHTQVGTYGKTWHFWQVDRGDALPYGALF